MRSNREATASFLLVAVEAALLLYLERRAPMREAREKRATRFVRNGVLAGLAAAATALVETPVATRCAALAEERRWGLLSRLGLPGPLRSIVAVVALDYAMYHWHAALHRVPLLWRLHLVHHADRDLDVTTALRVHLIEIALSVVLRVGEVIALGVTPRELALWQRLFACSIVFHHANVRLPAMLERLLQFAVVTPRIHSIHHLARRDAQHGNWSSGLVVWDWLHGTRREGDPAGDVGLPAYRDEAAVSLVAMLRAPLSPVIDAWQRR